ncbi:MAG: FG-GAP-like repeat-containing protein, partial [Pseudonocardiaceae bacterium]
MTLSLTHRPQQGCLRLALARRLSLGLCLAVLASLVMAGEASAGNIVNFSPPTSFQLPSNPGDVAVGDFNFDVDKDPDLAIASDASDVVTIKVGGAGGSFSTATTVPMTTGTRATAVAVGEFNLDGDSDLAVANHVGDTVSIATGGTGAAFSSPTTFSVGDFPVDVAVGD